jgi:2',3'-cyclic-nucleotide 2'-phosphodiesterase (5'-nucleotidase family)
VNAERAEQPNLLLLDTGDALVGGGALGDLTQGAAVLEGMGMMGYDAMALGPKELGLGAEVLEQRLAEAQMPIVSANVRRSGDGSQLVEPYTILEVGGRPVAVIGLTRPEVSVPADFEVEDPRAALERVVPEVASEADVVIVLTNLASQTAADYADMVPGIDLVIAALPAFQPKEIEETPTTGTKVIVAEQARSRHSGRRVGKLVAVLSSDGRVEPESWETIAMDKTIADDPAMDQMLEGYWDDFWGELDTE